MVTARLVPALVQLRAQINNRWPHRDKSSDGWVGDTAHAARVSDHNPDSGGWVHAIDVDKDGVDPFGIVNAAIHDTRTNYVIFQGLIYSRAYKFRARTYTGTNRHDKHIHISVLHGAPALSRAAWAIAGGTPLSGPTIELIAHETGTSPAPAPSSGEILRPGSHGPGVLVWQGELWRLGFGVGAHDGAYGPAVEQATRRLQEAAGIGADGVVGPATRAAARGVRTYPKAPGPVLPVCGPGGPHGTVLQFQLRLGARGWRLPATGRYSTRTREVLVGFQRQVRLPADGVGGPAVWAALWTRPVT